MGKTRPTKKRASILPADWAAAHANDPHRPLFVDDSMIDQDVAACLHEGARRVRFSDALDENKTDRHIDGVRFPGTRPIIIAFMGDSHLGHVAVDYGGVWDYSRILLANDGLYTIWVGDIIDNTPRFFNAEAVLEQFLPDDVEPPGGVARCIVLRTLAQLAALRRQPVRGCAGDGHGFRSPALVVTCPTSAPGCRGRGQAEGAWSSCVPTSA